MENQDYRQGNNKNNNNEGLLDNIGQSIDQTIENLMDTVNGDDQNSGQQKGRLNNSR